MTGIMRGRWPLRHRYEGISRPESYVNGGNGRPRASSNASAAYRLELGDRWGVHFNFLFTPNAIRSIATFADVCPFK